ncbi:MAG: hypothetical protein KDA84_12285 [Planctomycetaceae bacterium]|nr:hypothetical protein [Planctomycetaceae bacterium]
MKMTSISLKKSAGVLLLCGVCAVGCQKSSESGAYQEYSNLPNVEKTETTTTAQSEDSPNQTANPLPAVAEKPDQPAVAQASFERTSKTEAQADTANSEPGEPIAKVEETEVREIKLLIPEKTFDKASTDGTLRVSFDDLDLLKVLNMEPVPADAVEHFPGWLEQLDGQRIRIRGFMYPAFQNTGLRGFVLARDNQICCFGRDPKVYDLISVRMKEGTTTDYLPNRPFDVEGTFRIHPDPTADLLFGLYQIDDAKVITGRSR